MYTLQIAGTTTTTVPTTTTTVATDVGAASKSEVPETGINNFATYVILSAALIGLGLLVFTNPLGKNNES